MSKELENGVTLGNEMRGAGYVLYKHQVHEILDTNIEIIKANCDWCIPPFAEPFEIRRGKTRLWIGCVRFSLEELQAVREWLAEVPEHAKAEGR